MALPKFLLGDNSECSDDIFIVHTEYPQFILNLANDELEWFDDLKGDEVELTNEVAGLIAEANKFYDREMQRYEEQ